MSALGSTIPKLPGLPELPELPSPPELPSLEPPAPPPIPQMPGLPGTPERAAHVDKMVHAGRAKLTPDVAQKRANPRLSIEELNQSDPDELRDRFLNTKYDTRTPLQQVLDLVDLPRNVIANLAFHDAANEQAGKGETAAFGLPRVSVSDGLRSMGVENRVALALGGFAGDVALDPLTYVGPAGWGVKVGKTALRGVGAKTLKTAIKEAAAGGIHAVTDDAAKGVLKAAGLAETPMAEEALSKAVFGDFSKSKIERVFSTVGGERSASGGIFTKYADAAKTAANPHEHEAIDAVKSYVQKYGRGTGGGIKIGSGGSEIAHIPFTDITVQVPGFTPTGKSTVAALNIAKDRELGEVAPELLSVRDQLQGVRDLQEQAKKSSQMRTDRLSALEDRLKTVGNDPNLETEIKNAKIEHAKALEEYTAESSRRADEIKANLDAWLSNPSIPKNNPNSILAARDLWKEAQTIAAKTRAEADYWQTANLTHSAINGDITENVKRTTDTLNRLIKQQAGGESGGVKVGRWRVLEDPQIQSNLDELEMDFIPPDEIGGDLTQGEHARRWNELRAQLKALPKNNPHRDAILHELDMLSLQRIGYNPASAGPVDKTARTRGLLATTPDGALPAINADPQVQARAFEAARPLLDAIEDDSYALKKLQSGGKVSGEDVLPGMQALYRPEEVQSGADLAKMNELKARLAANREELRRVTAPLREGAAMHTTEDFENAVRSDAMAKLDTRTKALYDLAETDPKLADETARQLSRLADATLDYRDILGGTIGMHASGPIKDAVEVAKRSLGTSDDIAALSSIGQMASAARSVTGGRSNAGSLALEALDRRLRPFFGSRHGEHAAMMAKIRSDIRNYAQMGAHFGSEYMDGVLAAMRKVGITDPKMADDLGILAGMELHKLQDPSGTFQLLVPELDAAGRETGKMVPSKLTERMNALMAELRKKNPKEAEQLFADLREVAANAKGQLDYIADEGMRDYLLANVMEADYVPHTLAADAAQTLSLQKKNPQWRNPAMTGRGPKESFQRQRMSRLYSFPDVRPGMEGNTESFLEADRWVQDYDLISPEGRKAFEIEHGKAALDRAVELRERIDRYERLPVKPPSRQLDLYTTNDYIRRGRFAKFGEGINTFFEERLPVFMANRMASNERAKAMQDLLAIRSREELPIAPETLTNWTKLANTNGGTYKVKLKTGEDATVRIVTGRNGSKITAIDARGKTWRSLDPSLKKYDDNPVVKMITGALENSMVSEPMADFMEDVAKVWRDDNIAPMLSAISSATSVYRAMTLLHPSWYINDAIGNITLMAQGGVDLIKWAKMLPQAIKIRRFKDHPEELEKLVVELAGQKINGRTLADNAIAARAFGQHMANDTLQTMMVGATEARPSRMHPYAMKEGMRKDLAWRTAMWAGQGGDPSMFRKGAVNAMAGADIGWDQIKRRVFEPWMKGNGMMNDTMRLAAYMTMIDEGMDAAGAADKMRRVLYDLGDMTHFEQKVMRTVVPFYAWARSNLSYQVRQFFTDPKWAAAFPKVKEALEQALAGEQQIPESMRPSWMRASLATQIGTDPNSRYALMLGNAMPQLESLNLLQGVTGTQGAMNAGRYGLSNLNPILAVPAELSSGTDFYSGRSISGTPGSGDTTAGEFVAGSVRPLAEYGPGGRVQKAFEQGGAFQGVARAFGGGRIQAFDDARLQTTKARELRDQVEGLRRSITMAERNGDKGKSLRSRAMLLKTYEEALRLGLDKDVQVPKWAKTALGEMAG